MTLPVTSRTAWFNPETNAKLWQFYQAGSPYHNTPATNNSNVQAQEDEDATNLSAMSTTVPPTWKSTTPLMAFPCIAYDGVDDSLAWWNDAGTVAVAASQIFTTTAKTTGFVLYVTGATLNSASPWLNHSVWSESGGYLGLFVKASGGNYYLYFYNYAGTAQVTADYQISLNTSYVVTTWHDGTNIKIYINGVLWSTVASGTTTSLASQMGNSLGIGGRFQGRQGEQVYYNAALGATPLADLNDYLTGRWLASGTSALIAAVESSDTAVISAVNWATAQIASTESSDTAAMTGAATVGASIAATESVDSAAVTGANWVPAMISAIEAPDTAALTAEATVGAAIAATETPDTANVNATNTTTAAIASTEAPDTVAITGQNWTTAQIAATESADSAAVAAAATTGASIDATETPDTAAIGVGNVTNAQIVSTETGESVSVSAITVHATIAATEAIDTAAIVAEPTVGAAIAATEAPDLAAITADANLGVTSGTIAATEAGESAQITAVVPQIVTIAATESPDAADISAINWRNAQIAAIEAADLAHIESVVTQGASIAATEAGDHANIHGQSGVVVLPLVDPRYMARSNARNFTAYK